MGLKWNITVVGLECSFLNVHLPRTARRWNFQEILQNSGSLRSKDQVHQVHQVHRPALGCLKINTPHPSLPPVGSIPTTATTATTATGHIWLSLSSATDQLITSWTSGKRKFRISEKPLPGPFFGLSGYLGWDSPRKAMGMAWGSSSDSSGYCGNLAHMVEMPFFGMRKSLGGLIDVQTLSMEWNRDPVCRKEPCWITSPSAFRFNVPSRPNDLENNIWSCCCSFPGPGSTRISDKYRLMYSAEKNNIIIWGFPYRGVPQSSILDWDFPLINHQFGGTLIYGNPR